MISSYKSHTEHLQWANVCRLCVCNYCFYLQNSFQGALKVSAPLAGPAQTPSGSFVFGECDSEFPR